MSLPDIGSWNGTVPRKKYGICNICGKTFKINDMKRVAMLLICEGCFNKQYGRDDP